MGRSTQISVIPAEARPAAREGDLRRLHLVLLRSTVPSLIKLRNEKGQRWIKITYFRNLDLLHTPQARFPVDLVGEIIRATARHVSDATMIST